jgi:threonine dehydrogenase-like Zn-dependent dehydrogenase
MKAVHYDKVKKELATVEIEKPVPGPDEALVKVAAVGICGSDLELVKSDILRDGYIMGHEVSGVIESLGGNIKGFSVGDRIVTRPVGCGSCAVCRIGLTHLCLQKISIGTGSLPGGYAEYVKVPSVMLMKIPDGVGLVAAALVDTLAVPAHGLSRVGLSRKTAKDIGVCILGAGPIGISALMMIKDIGAKKIMAVDMNKERTALALSFGADEVISPRDDGYYDKVREFFSGIGPDAIFECTGRVEATGDALNLARPGGMVCNMGICFEPMSLNLLSLTMREITVIPSFSSLPEDNEAAMDFIAKNTDLVEGMISDKTDISGLPEIFTRLLRGEIKGKVVVEFE